jgi:hypothetical protein
VPHLRLEYERPIVLQRLGFITFGIVHVHHASVYNVCQDAVRRDLQWDPVANAVGSVVHGLSQRLDFAAVGCLHAQVFALQLVG